MSKLVRIPAWFAFAALFVVASAAFTLDTSSDRPSQILSEEISPQPTVSVVSGDVALDLFRYCGGQCTPSLDHYPQEAHVNEHVGMFEGTHMCDKTDEASPADPGCHEDVFAFSCHQSHLPCDGGNTLAMAEIVAETMDMELAKELLAHPDASFNENRFAIQVLDCQGLVGANIPLTPEQMGALEL